MGFGCQAFQGVRHKPGLNKRPLRHDDVNASVFTCLDSRPKNPQLLHPMDPRAEASSSLSTFYPRNYDPMDSISHDTRAETKTINPRTRRRNYQAQESGTNSMTPSASSKEHARGHGKTDSQNYRLSPTPLVSDLMSSPDELLEKLLSEQPGRSTALQQLSALLKTLWYKTSNS
ncbi:hypothetical protein BJV78DRAFT_528537 [Lactifluus subvellereus]|nr:hypothetical protein BJV78DRAFT_528537 [Lactifluus subvellereus]